MDLPDFPNDRMKYIFPPHENMCPDNWKVLSSNDNGVTCKRMKGPLDTTKGKCTDTKNFSNMKLKDKQCWAKECGVHWSGISNRSGANDGCDN